MTVPASLSEMGPSAAPEYGALVLTQGRAGPLHHSVNGDLSAGRQLHGRYSSGGVVRSSAAASLAQLSKGNGARASCDRLRCVLRAPGRPVDLERYALWEGS